MFDGNSQECLLELLKIQTQIVLFSDLFVLGESSENICDFFGLDDQRVQLESNSEIIPGSQDDFIVVFPLCDGSVGVFDKEIKQGFEIWFKFFENL